MNSAAQESVWQIGGGTTDRDCGRTFLDHDVALLGPGDPGQWRPDRHDAEFGGSFVRRFANDVNNGDLILLRSGAATVRAVGVVAGEYKHLDLFDDVMGWDLQHSRRVRWRELEALNEFPTRVFGPRPSRFSRVHDKDAVALARGVLNSPPDNWKSVPLRDLPEEVPTLSPGELPSGIAGLVSLAQDLYPRFWNQNTFGDDPSEHELVCHFVIPLLQALGWRTEHIGVEWRRIDVALFSDLPRTPDTCELIIEAKRLTVGAESALGQARQYLEKLGFIRDILVTDGIRYRLYDHKSAFLPVAYANLFRPKVSAKALFDRLSKSKRRI